MREKALAAWRRVGVVNNGLSGKIAFDPFSRSERRLVANKDTALAASSNLWATMVSARLTNCSYSRLSSGIRDRKLAFQYNSINQLLIVKILAAFRILMCFKKATPVQSAWLLD